MEASQQLVTGSVLMHVEASINSDPQEELALDEDTLDPNMHYYWGHMRGNRQATLRRRGYRPVLRSKDGVRTMLDDEGKETADDLIRDGDLILMCAPKEVSENRKARKSHLARSRLETAEQDFRQKAQVASNGLQKAIQVIGVDKGD